MNKLGKPGCDYIMDMDIQAIIDKHEGDVKEMHWTCMGLNVEIEYIKESNALSEEEKKVAVQRYREVMTALRKEINGEKQT